MAKARNEKPRRLSGFCGHSGFHDKCRVSYWCECSCHKAANLDSLARPPEDAA